MSTIDFFCQTMNINLTLIPKEEKFILEAEVFTQTCCELVEAFKAHYHPYIKLLKFDKEGEVNMLETNFLRLIINDILASKDYSIEGIAYYTRTPEDVLCDLMVGENTIPSLHLSQKIIELHRLVRPDLYREIMKKIVVSYAQAG